MHLLIMLYCGLFFGLFVAQAFKNCATDFLVDSQLAIAANVGLFCNGSFRFVWAALFDYYGFKKVYTVVMILQLVASSTIYVARANHILYTIIVGLSFVCYGCHYSLFPATCAKIFGTKSGGKVCSYLFMIQAVSSLTGFAISNLSKTVNYQAVYMVALGLTAGNIVMLTFFKEEEVTKKKKVAETKYQIN